MQNGMAMDFSWLSSAQKYLELYEKTVATKKEAAASKQLAAGRGRTTDDR